MEQQKKYSFLVKFTDGTESKISTEDLLNELSGSDKLAESVKVIEEENLPEQPNLENIS